MRSLGLCELRLCGFELSLHAVSSIKLSGQVVNFLAVLGFQFLLQLIQLRRGCTLTRRLCRSQLLRVSRLEPFQLGRVMGLGRGLERGELFGVDGLQIFQLLRGRLVTARLRRAELAGMRRDKLLLLSGILFLQSLEHADVAELQGFQLAGEMGLALALQRVDLLGVAGFQGLELTEAAFCGLARCALGTLDLLSMACTEGIQALLVFHLVGLQSLDCGGVFGLGGRKRLGMALESFGMALGKLAMLDLKVLELALEVGSTLEFLNLIFIVLADRLQLLLVLGLQGAGLLLQFGEGIVLGLGLVVGVVNKFLERSERSS